MSYQYIGNFSAVDPAYSIGMSCHECKVKWTGCWDNFQCPRCGEGELPSCDPEQLLAAKEDGMNNELRDKVIEILADVYGRQAQVCEAADEIIDLVEHSLTQQQVAEPPLPGELCAPVVFIDALGAGRTRPEDCRDGVSYIQHAGRTYWPLSERDNRRLLQACCGRGQFDGPQVPEGYVLVPVEPTDEMLRCAQKEWLADPLRRSTTLYRAMLNAAPAPEGGK